jgi:hypothetical protein
MILELLNLALCLLSYILLYHNFMILNLVLFSLS